LQSFEIAKEDPLGDGCDGTEAEISMEEKATIVVRNIEEYTGT
jgi:hypothetical protein